MKIFEWSPRCDADSGQLLPLVLSDAFKEEDALLQADVLRDLVGQVALLYRDAVEAAFPDGDAPAEAPPSVPVKES